ncbi:unnamed protein product [Closterium sp. NIES-53]
MGEAVGRASSRAKQGGGGQQGDAQADQGRAAASRAAREQGGTRAGQGGAAASGTQAGKGGAAASGTQAGKGGAAASGAQAGQGGAATSSARAGQDGAAASGARAGQGGAAVSGARAGQGGAAVSDARGGQGGAAASGARAEQGDAAVSGARAGQWRVGPSAVEVLLGGTPRAASEDTRAAVVQPRVTAEERVPGRQARALQKMTTAADAAAVLTAADAGQPGPTTQKRQRAAPSADVAQVNAPPPLTAQQLQALFSLLQQQAPGTIATSTDYNSASAKTEKQKEAVATRTTKVARATTAVPAPALPTEPVQVPAIDDSDNSDNDDGEAPDNLARHRILAPAPPLPPLNLHVEFKLRNGDVEGALSNVAQVETLINKRFEVLLVADEAGFEAADRFQLYQAKSVLTSRSYKLAVADVAALKRARTGFARGGRLPARDGEPESKGMPPVGCHKPRFKGVCFHCGQPGHMANNCPMGGRGAQGPAPVV